MGWVEEAKLQDRVHELERVLTQANEELVEIADRTDETTGERIDSVRALIKDAL